MGNAVLASTVGGATIIVADLRSELTDGPFEFHEADDVPASIAELVGRFVAPGFAIALMERNIADDDAGCVVDAETIRLTGVMQDGDGNAQALVEWHIHPDAVGPHIRLEWVVRVGGAGARPHLAAALDFALAAGFTSIRLHAGLSSGPTYWARAGFDFVHESARMFVNEIADELLHEYSEAPRFVTAYDAWSFDGAHSTIRAAFLALQRIAPTYRSEMQFRAMESSPLHAVEVDELRPLGHAALYAINPWAGQLDLTDADAVARFQELLDGA